MKTPHAILIGLSLIAAAIYFKDTAVKPAYASSHQGIDMAYHFGQHRKGLEDRCWIRHGYYLNLFNRKTTTADQFGRFRWSD